MSVSIHPSPPFCCPFLPMHTSSVLSSSPSLPLFSLSTVEMTQLQLLTSPLRRCGFPAEWEASGEEGLKLSSLLQPLRSGAAREKVAAWGQQDWEAVEGWYSYEHGLMLKQASQKASWNESTETREQIWWPGSPFGQCRPRLDPPASSWRNSQWQFMSRLASLRSAGKLLALYFAAVGCDAQTRKKKRKKVLRTKEHPKQYWTAKTTCITTNNTDPSTSTRTNTKSVCKHAMATTHVWGRYTPMSLN